MADNLEKLNDLIRAGIIKVSFTEERQGQKDAFRLILERDDKKCFMPIDRYIIEFAYTLTESNKPYGKNPCQFPARPAEPEL